MAFATNFLKRCATNSALTRATKKAVLPSFTQRFSSHWENLGKMIPNSKRDEFNSHVGEMRKRLTKAQNVQELGGVDWDSYREALGDETVNSLKKEYDNYQYTDFNSKMNAEVEAMKAEMQAITSGLGEQANEISDLTAKASEELAELRRTRTTLDTVLDDVLRRHPEINEELEARIAEDDWDTEVAPVDVDGKRVQLIQERWNAEAMGKLDDNSTKEFVSEVESLAADATENSESSAYDQIPDLWKNELKEWHQILGKELNPEELAASSPLFNLEEEREGVDDSLKADSSVDVSGKSVDELKELAEAAADNGDYFEATQYLRAAKIQDGSLDASSDDISSFSGRMNFFEKLSAKLQN